MSGFNINRAVQSGNLCADPELRSLPSGTSLCKLRLAVNERYKDSYGEWCDRANYFDWTVWGGIGEWVAGNMAEGDAVTLEGRARWHSWETEDGAKRSRVEFTADSIVPGRPPRGRNSDRERRETEQAEYDASFSSNERSDTQTDREMDAAVAGGGQKDEDDDIPFRWMPVDWDERYHQNR